MARSPRMAPGADPFQRQLTIRQRTEREQFRPTQAIIIHAPDDTTVGVAATTLYTVPADRFCRVERLFLTNPTTGTETVTVYIVQSGGTAGTANAIIFEEALASKSRSIISEPFMLPPEATLQAKTSTSGGVNVTFWGHEIEGT